ncbi:hypothetical protein [Vibrio parahaemolyticus]|nr:hypothetical protein [Vibrio parahaemolyticus]
MANYIDLLPFYANEVTPVLNLSLYLPVSMCIDNCHLLDFQ